MTKDPPATLDEPDTDCEVIQKLRAEIENLQERLADQQAQWGYTESIQTLKIERLRETAGKLLAAMDDMHEKGETFTARVSLAVSEMRRNIQ